MEEPATAIQAAPANALEERIVDAYPEYWFEASGGLAGWKGAEVKDWYVALSLKSKAQDEKCDFDGEGTTFALAIANLASKLDRLPEGQAKQRGLGRKTKNRDAAEGSHAP